MSFFETEDEMPEDYYEQAINEQERQAEEERQILEDAGMGDASDGEQETFLDDYYDQKRDAEQIAWDEEMDRLRGR
jgi:hypothetical protein